MPNPNKSGSPGAVAFAVKNAAVPVLRLKEEANGKVYQAADSAVRNVRKTADAGAKAVVSVPPALLKGSAQAAGAAANSPETVQAAGAAAALRMAGSRVPSARAAVKSPAAASEGKPVSKARASGTPASASAAKPAVGVAVTAPAPVSSALRAPESAPGAKSVTRAPVSTSEAQKAKAVSPVPGAGPAAARASGSGPVSKTAAKASGPVPVASSAAKAPATAVKTPAPELAVKTAVLAPAAAAGQDAGSALKTQIKQLNTLGESGVKPELSPALPAGKDGSTMKQPAGVKAQPVAGTATAGEPEVKPEPGIKPGSAEEDAAIKLAKTGEQKAPSLFERISSFWQNLSFKVKVSLLFVLLPGAVSYIYFAFLASPMYIAEAKFAVKNSSSATPAVAMGIQLFGGGSSSTQDAMVVEEYLKTVDSFYAIDSELNLKEHYSSESYDYISRMYLNPTQDEIHKFWNRVSSVEINQDSGVVTFTVRAYTPEMAQAAAKSALKQSEKLVNSMNERAKDDALSLAREEVEAAEKRLGSVQNQLKTFRTEHKVLDVKSSAEGMEGLILQLESQAAEVKTQIAESELYMQADTPALKALRARLQGIEQQIEAERVRLTDINESGNSLNSLVSQYETLNTEAEFARQQLVAAMTSQEQAKIELLSKSLYLVTLAEPRLPDESLYPEPFLFSFYLMLTLGMAYLIGSVLIDAIKEHMGY